MCISDCIIGVISGDNTKIMGTSNIRQAKNKHAQGT